MNKPAKESNAIELAIAACGAFILLCCWFVLRQAVLGLAWAAKAFYKYMKNRPARKAKTTPQPAKSTTPELFTPKVFEGMSNLAPAKEFDLRNGR